MSVPSLTDESTSAHRRTDSVGHDFGCCIYDGDCAVCQRSVDLARTLRARCAFITSADILSEASPRVLSPSARAELSPERCAREVVFVDPRDVVTGGSSAVARVLMSSELRVIRAAGGILDVPVMRPLAQRVYSLVARNRHRIPVRGYCST